MVVPRNDRSVGPTMPAGPIAQGLDLADLDAPIVCRAVDVAPVPQPAAAPLLLAGLGCLAVAGRLRRKSARPLSRAQPDRADGAARDDPRDIPAPPPYPCAMRIATFNINGVKARAGTLQDWLREDAPDLAVLQEIKSTDEAFPREVVEDAGYTLHTHGQKGFNGVALCSRVELDDVATGLPGDDDDAQARYIEATAIGTKGAVRVCGLYLPNGNPAPGPKYDYKLAWMARLETRIRQLLADETPFLVTGDFNVIPQDIDAARPERWREDALALPATRAAYRRLENLGLTDAVRTRHPGQAGHFSFWDYQRAAWEENNGIRIDHFLLSPAIADLMTGASIQAEMRGRDKPSDHVPVWLDLDL